tara:strand:+ start:571 stop:720 length:150 start_codon:yes stop_codon:yes gene_type:complete
MRKQEIKIPNTAGLIIILSKELVSILELSSVFLTNKVEIQVKNKNNKIQ